MTLNFSPQIEATLKTAARQQGVDIETLIERMVNEQLTHFEERNSPIISAKNAAAIAYFERRLKEEKTDDPDEIRMADAEVEELMQNLNNNRIESGESPLFS